MSRTDALHAMRSRIAAGDLGIATLTPEAVDEPKSKSAFIPICDEEPSFVDRSGTDAELLKWFSEWEPPKWFDLWPWRTITDSAGWKKFILHELESGVPRAPILRAPESPLEVVYQAFGNTPMSDIYRCYDLFGRKES